jgi:hypothetical protein
MPFVPRTLLTRCPGLLRVLRFPSFPSSAREPSWRNKPVMSVSDHCASHVVYNNPRRRTESLCTVGKGVYRQCTWPVQAVAVRSIIHTRPKHTAFCGVSCNISESWLYQIAQKNTLSTCTWHLPQHPLPCDATNASLSTFGCWPCPKPKFSLLPTMAPESCSYTARQASIPACRNNSSRLHPK